VARRPLAAGLRAVHTDRALTLCRSERRAARAVALAGLLVVVTALTESNPTTSGLAPVRTTAVRVGRILDVESGRYTGPSVILVRAGRISAVLPASDYSSVQVDTTIDASRLTILPGLIDAHVHLAIGGPPTANALADLRAGFTTVADLGARTHRLLRIRDSINAGFIPGPRVLAAGIWVGKQHGVCEFNGIGIPGGPDEYRARVRANAEAGAEIAKLCVSGWPRESFDQPLKYEMPDDALAATVDEAKRLRRIVIAHDISLGGVRAALAAGVHGLAHAAYLDSAAARDMRARGVFMIPTLTSLTAGDTSAASTALFAAVALADRLGVLLVFGTDGGVLPHGRNAEEFAALTRAGVSPLTAIRSATVTAATALRIADSVGVIRPGMVADLVAVDVDPLSDLTVLSRPLLVMSRGSVVVAPR
jgi:imidazolonepropionase-like amidohydrolase